MSGAAVQAMSLDQFLAWEREQPDRWEFDAGTTVMMTGGSVAHSRISTNLTGELYRHLRGTRCSVWNSDAKILPAGRERSYYPDISVTCSPAAGNDDGIVPNPVLVIEVVSPSTGNRDRGIKKFAYFSTSSIQQYAIVEQDALRIDLYTREGARWANTVVEGLDAILPLTSIGMDLPLRLIYEGTSLLASDWRLRPRPSEGPTASLERRGNIHHKERRRPGVARAEAGTPFPLDVRGCGQWPFSLRQPTRDTYHATHDRCRRQDHVARRIPRVGTRAGRTLGIRCRRHHHDDRRLPAA